MRAVGLGRSFGCSLGRGGVRSSGCEAKNDKRKRSRKHDAASGKDYVFPSQAKEAETNKSVSPGETVGGSDARRGYLSSEGNRQPRHEHGDDRKEYPLHRSSVGATP